MTALGVLLQRVKRTRERVSREEIEQLLRRDRYTGPVLFHYKDGFPLRVVPLDREEGIDLDKTGVLKSLDKAG